MAITVSSGNLCKI